MILQNECEENMKKRKFVLVVIIILLASQVNSIYAQDIQPPVPEDQKTETSFYTRWRTDENTGLLQKYFVIEEKNQITITTNNEINGQLVSPLGWDYVIGGVTYTLTRLLEGTPYYDGGIGGTAYKVRAGAQTQSNVCVQEIYVKAKHKYWGPTTPVNWIQWPLGKYDLLGCKDNTGTQYTNLTTFFPNTTHVAVADHTAKYNGSVSLNRLNDEGPTKVW